MMQRVMDRRPGCEGAENKDKQAQHNTQNGAVHGQSHFVLTTHDGYLSQCRASGKTEFTCRSKA